DRDLVHPADRQRLLRGEVLLERLLERAGHEDAPVGVRLAAVADGVDADRRLVAGGALLRLHREQGPLRVELHRRRLSAVAGAAYGPERGMTTPCAGFAVGSSS